MFPRDIPKQKAPFIENKMERYSLATNLVTKINRMLSAGVNYRFTYQKAQDATPNSLRIHFRYAALAADLCA